MKMKKFGAEGDPALRPTTEMDLIFTEFRESSVD